MIGTLSSTDTPTSGVVRFIDEDEVPGSAVEYLSSAVSAPRQMGGGQHDGEGRPRVRPVWGDGVVTASVNESATLERRDVEAELLPELLLPLALHRRRHEQEDLRRSVRQKELLDNKSSLYRLAEANLVGQEVGPWPGLEDSRSYGVLMRPRFDRQCDEPDTGPPLAPPVRPEGVLKFPPGFCINSAVLSLLRSRPGPCAVGSSPRKRGVS